MRKLRFLVPASFAVALIACGGGTEDDVASTGPGTAGSSGIGGSAGGAGTAGSGTAGAAGGGTAGAAGGGAAGAAGAGPGPCDAFVPKATAADVAKTPRANAAAEILAIETSGAFVAPDALYDRVVKELAAIGVAEPQVAAMQPMSPVSSPTLVVGFDAATYAQVETGSYHGWDCANAAYGVTKTAPVGAPPYVTVEFGTKRYNTPLLAKEYKALPGVKAADPNLGGGDGPDVCLEIQGDTHFYVFDKAGGDCPAGCTEHAYRGFSVTSSGVVTALGVFDPALPMPEPTWFAMLKDCRSRL